jgi:hypothetical protein
MNNEDLSQNRIIKGPQITQIAPRVTQISLGVISVICGNLCNLWTIITRPQLHAYTPQGRPVVKTRVRAVREVSSQKITTHYLRYLWTSVNRY